MECTPERIRDLPDDHVFVFGSNRAGRHGRGAALTAFRKFGAKNGQGDGLMGAVMAFLRRVERWKCCRLLKLKWLSIAF